jgi:hypothetical protein
MADRAGNPPTSSSLVNEKHVPSLLLSTAGRGAIGNCRLKPWQLSWNWLA